MTTEEIRAYMRQATDESGSSTSCATPSELTDYFRDACAPDIRETIQVHLMGCAECREALLNLAGFAAAAEEPSPVSDPGVERKWRQLRKRLRAEERNQRRPAWLAGLWPVCTGACAIAASLAITWGLFVQQRFSNLQLQYSSVVRQQAEAAELARSAQSALALSRAPQVNLPVFDALPSGSTERAGEQGTNTFALPASGRFALVLSGAAQRHDAAYRIEIRNERRELAFSAPGLKPDNQGNLVITFDRGFLPAGRYALEVAEQTENRLAPVARYSIRLIDQRESPKMATPAQ